MHNQFIIIITCFILAIFNNFSLQGQPISDISTADGSYEAISRSINLGYLSLFNDQTFRPNYALSRRDAALLLDKLTLQIKANKLPLSTNELQELELLSKSFKQTYTSTSNDISMLKTTTSQLNTEYIVLQDDISKLTESIAVLEKKQKWLMVTLAGVGILSILF